MGKINLINFFKKIIETIGNFINDDDIDDIEVPLTGDLAKDPIEAITKNFKPTNKMPEITKCARTSNLPNRTTSNTSKATNTTREEKQELGDR